MAISTVSEKRCENPGCSLVVNITHWSCGCVGAGYTMAMGKNVTCQKENCAWTLLSTSRKKCGQEGPCRSHKDTN